MNISSSAASVALLVASFAFVGCRGKPVTYQSTIRIQRAVAVASDEHQKPLSVDVTFVWAECPGEQRQTVRSGQDLAACLPKLKPGMTVPVTVIWEKEEHGGYDWHVIEMAGCAIPATDDDDSSFESVQDCHPTTQHGAVLGFHCDRTPEGELLEKCPWFRRD